MFSTAHKMISSHLLSGKVASKNLKKDFFEALDHHTTALIDLFKSSKGVGGQSLGHLLQPISTQVRV